LRKKLILGIVLIIAILSVAIYIILNQNKYEKSISRNADTSQEENARVEKPEDVKRLLEAGFDFVCQKDNLIFLRKRK